MSKFSALATLKQQPPVQPQKSTPAVPKEQPKPVRVEQSTGAKPGAQPQPASVGKYKNPAYVQRTAYIQKTTDYAVKMKLLQQGGEKEFSELVEELLATWLKEQ
jgi:hypothetical protein